MCDFVSVRIFLFISFGRLNLVAVGFSSDSNVKLITEFDRVHFLARFLYVYEFPASCLRRSYVDIVFFFRCAIFYLWESLKNARLEDNCETKNRDLRVFVN